MSKMKYLFRKLHIGGGVNGHHQHHRLPPQDRPLTSPQSQLPPTVSLPPSAASTSSSPRASSLTRAASLESAENSADFNFFEEEFQVQLALAISVSDPDSRDDPEAAQIKAAKQISLGCSPSETLVETLSLRYWSYNFLNYNEKVIDGFYDIYGMTLSSGEQGKIPKLLELQAISVSDNADCEVVVVNHTVDPVLLQLEQRVHAISMQYQSFEQSQILSDLIQNIADIVVSRMGGLVTDADDMLKRWNNRSRELRNSMDSIVLPLGCLDIGLSRHRALLFKVLADHINLPCMLVKGSYYTGTDEGAVNLVKLGNGSEYIVDLMGSPGTLVPAELPSDNLQSCGLHISDRTDYGVKVEDLCPVLGQETALVAVPPNSSPVPKDGSSYSVDGLGDTSHSNKEKCNVEDPTKRFENDFGKLFPSLRKSCEDLLSVGVESSAAQKMQVQDVSECVISASKNPEFAQKLHAVLLENGTPRLPDLFPDLSPHDIKVMKILENFNLASGEEVYGRAQNYSDALLSNDARLLVSSTGEQSFGGAHIDNTHKHPSEGFTKEIPVWDCNAFNNRYPSPSDTTNGVYVHVNRVAEAKNQQNYAPLGIVSSVNQHGRATRTLDGEQAQKSFAPSTANQYEEHSKKALVDDGELFVNDQVGDVLDNVRKEKRCTVRLMERVGGSPPIPCNVQNGRIDPVLGEVADWEIPWDDLLIGERIGIGSYGEVYRADWNGTEVAVKKFMDQDLSGDALAQFKCEAEIMLRLRHPNIVLFMGAVARPPNLSILTEYLPRGSLFKLLHRPNIQLDEKRRMRMAIDVAKGMNYLHTCHPIIVHRDLKTPNLLVDKNWNVKVCDFGLSRMKHHTFLSSKSTAGTPEWMAPEVLRNEPSNEKCDVYSFGVILWEFATLRVPWSDMNSMQVVGAVGFQNRHLDIPEEIDPVVAEIIMDCWQRDPQLRPSFGQLMSRLKSLERLQRPDAARTSQPQSSKR